MCVARCRSLTGCGRGHLMHVLTVVVPGRVTRVWPCRWGQSHPRAGRGWPKDGNGEFPVGYCLPIPVPAGEYFPRPRPRERSRGTFFPHPRTRAGNVSPTGPHPREVSLKKNSDQQYSRNIHNKRILHQRESRSFGFTNHRSFAAKIANKSI
jgi:hypothetical protein